MKEELIEKLLNEQATPEEEHLIARELRQRSVENTDWWLMEDETETYDRLVAERHSRRRLVRWTAAAAVAVLMAAGTIVLWPHGEPSAGSAQTATQTTKAKPAAEQGATVLRQTAAAGKPAAPVASTTSVVAQKSAPTPAKAKVKATSKDTNTTDSLQYYIARLEQELAQVTDSSYTAKAEQIIRADARLQRLVQRIMMGEITRGGQPVEAMVSQEGKEELP